MKEERDETLKTDEMRKKVASMFKQSTESDAPLIDFWTLRFLEDDESRETNHAFELQFSV